MKRLLLVGLLSFGAMMRPATAADYTDIWYNSLQPGYGYNIVESDNGTGHPFLFVTFFIFGGNGDPTWYTAQLTWNGTDSFTGPVYKSVGTFFGSPWNQAANHVTSAGTATFRPSTTNDYQGTLSYNVPGVGSAVNTLERQTLTMIATGGTYAGAQTGAYSGCTPSSGNGSYTDFHQLVVTHNTSGAATYAFTFESGLTCTLAGNYEQHGQYYTIRNASYTCSDGLNTTATLTDIKSTVHGIEGSFTARTVAGGCSESAAFSGVLTQ